MRITTTTNHMFSRKPAPLAARFDEAEQNFTVDATHESAKRLTELSFQVIDLASGPREDESSHEYVQRYEAQLADIRKEVNGLTNEATGDEYYIAFMSMSDCRLRRNAVKRADEFLEAFPEAVDCSRYLLDALCDAAGLEAVLRLGFHMGRGEGDKHGRKE